MLAGEERSLDEWGKIRLFEVGPQVPPWRDSTDRCYFIVSEVIPKYMGGIDVILEHHRIIDTNKRANILIFPCVARLNVLPD